MEIENSFESNVTSSCIELINEPIELNHLSDIINHIY